MSRFPSEAAFQGAVVELARYHRCQVWHDNDSRRNAPGFPDLVIVGRRGVLWRELKTERGRLRPEQEMWLSRLTRAGQDAAVWRPDAWPDRIRDEIRRVA